MRTFQAQSTLTEGSLALALAPALTPIGIENNPDFFSGFAAYPQVLARGLLVLADITSTRYYNYTPSTLRDPVLSAQGDRLRAECFSACNGVYARLDLLQGGFEGEIAHGTTNVDIGIELRAALTQIKQQDKLHVAIGSGGFAARPISANNNSMELQKRIIQRPVQMPDRWVRALGNTAEIHKGMAPIFTLKGMQAKSFIASLPSATGKNQAGWLKPATNGVKLSPRPATGGAYISGMHRLSALKRVLTNLESLTFYMPINSQPGPFMIEANLPYARLTLSLTAEAWQGYSGEGALLAGLAHQNLLEDAKIISNTLGFDAAIDLQQASQRWSMSQTRAQSALSLLAVSGKLGFDAHENAYFHRQLPDEPNRILKDNPRLTAARALVGAVTNTGENLWAVASNDTTYRVYYNSKLGAADAKCTCTWYLKHQNSRGPCKHILAVQLMEEQQ